MTNAVRKSMIFTVLVSCGCVAVMHPHVSHYIKGPEEQALYARIDNLLRDGHIAEPRELYAGLPMDTQVTFYLCARAFSNQRFRSLLGEAARLSKRSFAREVCRRDLGDMQRLWLFSILDEMSQEDKRELAYDTIVLDDLNKALSAFRSHQSEAKAAAILKSIAETPPR